MNDLTDREFRKIRDYIKVNYGIHLGDKKKSLVYSRLRASLEEKSFTSFTQYFDYLIQDHTGEAVKEFIDKITTNHTFFMREADHFDHFRRVTLPYIEAVSPHRDLRVWCAGCATGEEAYTLQMLALDYFRDKPGWNTEILATDISAKVLAFAEQGMYEAENLRTLPFSWRRDYFRQNGDGTFSASKELKRSTIFRTLNLMEPVFPFHRPFHAIFCRNVMIYFDNATRDALVRRFYNATADGGYLYIGHSESLNQTNAKYKYMLPAIYRRPVPERP